MSEFETILMMLLIPLYGVMFYTAGRMNLFEILLREAEEKLKEFDDNIKDSF